MLSTSAQSAPTMQAGDRARLVKGWQNWRAVLAEAMDNIHDCIEAGEYVKASAIMDEITMQQAQTSLTMRSILVRAGVIGEEGADPND